MSKIGRNQSCPCGSGKKYKKCHGSIAAEPRATFDPSQMQHILEQHRASERIRETQQGRGRPIVAFKQGEQQIVAVGNTVYFSDKWKTFPDFLAEYIKRKFDPAWGNAEIAKPFEQRHPIMQWYDAYCRYQQASITTPGVPSSAAVTGIVASYLGLAYSLYLLDHNVELQARLIARLKDPANFQGAFYELVVANILIRAGFTLTLEDETDGTSKHCEFAAVSKRTGKRYWVEAKMRSIVGLLGKTEKDGGSDDNPISRLIPHLNAALAKPAADERLIFIDLNAETKFTADMKPSWHDAAIGRLERFEKKELTEGTTAYVFVTNVGFHRNLNGTPQPVAAPFGLGIPDFNRPGYYRLVEVYRKKQRHIDAHEIGAAFLEYTKFPSSFDGSLPSEVLGEKSNRVIIGESYFFEDAAPGGLLATVTTATVNEQEKKAYIGVADQTGNAHILTQPMTDLDLEDFKAHPDAYFGRVMPVSKTMTDPYELFEWMMNAHKGMSREKLLQQLSGLPNFEAIKNFSDEDLLAEYCELMVGAFQSQTAPKNDGTPG